MPSRTVLRTWPYAPPKRGSRTKPISTNWSNCSARGGSSGACRDSCERLVCLQRRPSALSHWMPSPLRYACNSNVSKAERSSRSRPISSPSASLEWAKVMPSVRSPMNWLIRATRSCGQPPQHSSNACSLPSVTCVCPRSWQNWTASPVSSSTTLAMCNRIGRRWKSCLRFWHLVIHNASFSCCGFQLDDESGSFLLLHCTSWPLCGTILRVKAPFPAIPGAPAIRQVVALAHILPDLLRGTLVTTHQVPDRKEVGTGDLSAEAGCLLLGQANPQI